MLAQLKTGVLIKEAIKLAFRLVEYLEHQHFVGCCLFSFLICHTCPVDGFILAKDTFVHKIWEKLLVRMEHFWDLLFQLMKHGTNTLHVAVVFVNGVMTLLVEHPRPQISLANGLQIARPPSLLSWWAGMVLWHLTPIVNCTPFGL